MGKRQVTYTGRASRIRLVGGRVLTRNVGTQLDDQVADQLAGNPDYVVDPPAPPAPARTRGGRAATTRPRTTAQVAPVATAANTAAAAPAGHEEGADPATAAPAVTPDAAEGVV